MTVSDEKKGVSKCLRESLRRAGASVEGPTEIAREFNLRYHGTPVTRQAVRKWLEAKSLRKRGGTGEFVPLTMFGPAAM